MTAQPSRPLSLGAAPSPLLPLGFFVPALGLLLAAGGSLPLLAARLADWHYQQEVLAVVHAVTLGFLLATFLGATVQLLPVLSGQELRSTGRIRLANALFLAGALGMVLHFWKLRWPGLIASAALVITAVTLLLSALVPLLRHAGSEPGPLGVGLALAGLVATMTLGLLSGIDRYRTFLPGGPMDHLAAHLHLGLLGTFTVAIFGVEARLLPMFLVSSPPSDRRQRATVVLASAGTLALATALFLGWPAAPFALPLLVALGLQLANVREIVARRRRRQIEPGFLLALTAYADLAVAAVVGLLLALGVGRGTMLPVRLAWVYGCLLLVGFVLQTVLGILTKILPFLVWNAVYARRVGLSPVPLLRDLTPEALPWIGFWLLRISSTLLAVALLRGRVVELRLAATLFAASLVPFAVHAGMVVRHLVRPRAPLGAAHAIVR